VYAAFHKEIINKEMRKYINKKQLRCRSDLRVHWQCVQLVLLVRLGFAIEVPGNLGNRAALDDDWDPDGVSSSDVDQVVRQHVQHELGFNCGGQRAENISEELQDTEIHDYYYSNPI